MDQSNYAEISIVPASHFSGRASAPGPFAPRQRSARGASDIGRCWHPLRLAVSLASALCSVLLAVAFAPRSAPAQSPDVRPFLIGTYTGETSRGIYRSEMDVASGRLAPARLVAECTNPSFLAIHPTQPVVYAVSETPDGQVLAFRLVQDGTLRLLSRHASAGSAPCYVTTDASGRYVLIANYSSGSIVAFRAREDGDIEAMTYLAQHRGHSVNPRRQQGPHAHCVQMDPTDRFACAVDLGLDQIIVYELDKSDGALRRTSTYQARPGSGPRHLAFHPGGSLAVVIHELASEITSLRWLPDEGRFIELTTVSTLPAGYAGENYTAEVLFHPNGRWVYGSNRGHDSIAIFRIDAEGHLHAVGHCSTGGKTPRNFRIDPSGRYLLAENQNSNSIQVLRIDAQTGQLAAIDGAGVEVGKPVCIRFLPQLVP
ncbi:MAG: lactonase family protein [Planctomycetota bacterium]|nr:MAG: lactonase family protein [Planctomycetota bacterium]